MGHLAAEPVTEGGGDIVSYKAAHMGSAGWWCGEGSFAYEGVNGRSDSRARCGLGLIAELGSFSWVANGHNNELFFPCTVKSCSSTVERDVRRADNLMLLLAPDTETVDPVDVPFKAAIFRAARRPSLIAMAVCCFELVRFAEGRGTIPARSGTEI